jgi:Family of unknown function (DUF6951)
MSGRAEVVAGICGHGTSIEAIAAEGRMVGFTIETTCDNVERFTGLLDEHGPVDAYAEINPRGESVVLACGREGGCCVYCIVPAAALKAMRVATGLALVADVSIVLTKE